MQMTIQLFGILRDVLGSWGSWTHNDDYIPHVLGVCSQFRWNRYLRRKKNCDVSDL